MPKVRSFNTGYETKANEFFSKEYEKKNEKIQRKDESGKKKKRKITTVTSASNKKKKNNKSPIVTQPAVKGGDLDLTAEYSSMLKKYEKMFELPPITKNHPRCPLDYDIGYWKALKKYVKSKDDMSLANRYV